MLDKITADNKSYFKFTGPQRLNRAVHELHGILLGVTADAKVNDRELSRLNQWITDHREFRDRQPFKEVFGMLSTVLADGIVDESELADLFWMCSRFSDENEYYNEVTADMQRLQGLMAGIAADSIITAEEITALDQWMAKREHLKGCWPFDDLESVITHALKDGKISAEEQSQLLRFFGEFSTSPGQKAVKVTEDLIDFAIGGVCALAPELVFPERVFCLTGTSERAPRSEIQKLIVARGGVCSKSLTKKVHYLVVGCEGNPCWAFSCYGRKVEEAMKLRKDGHKLVIVHEVDFWDHIH
jgi:hypothetical protein